MVERAEVHALESRYDHPIDVTKSSGDIKATGTLTPPLAGVEMSVTLARRQNGTWVRLAEKTPAVKASGAFNASFRRPKAGALPGHRPLRR